MSRFSPLSSTLVVGETTDRHIVEACDPHDYAFRVEEAEIELGALDDEEVVVQEIWEIDDGA